MTDYHFFYGSLRHAPLRLSILGEEVGGETAWLPDHGLRSATAANWMVPFAMVITEEGAETVGLLVDLGPVAAERLRYYQAGFVPVEMMVRRANGIEVAAKVWLPDPRRLSPVGPWDFDAWQAEWGEAVTEASIEYMTLMPRMTREMAIARYPRMLARASARLRARRPRPATLRRRPEPDDIVIETMGIGYAKFFSVEDYTLRHRRFSGGFLGPIERAAFVSGDAAVVLPYDPVRDRVLLIEQFRAGPMARGDANPWQLEAVAGLVDAGETPEETVLREAQEEAGVTINRLIPAPDFYPSPGAKSEYIYSFIGISDLHDDAARPGGLAAEGEDIRPHLIPFTRMMELVDSGEIENAPLVVLALWLARRRDALRAAI